MTKGTFCRGKCTRLGIRRSEFTTHPCTQVTSQWVSLFLATVQVRLALLQSFQGKKSLIHNAEQGSKCYGRGDAPAHWFGEALWRTGTCTQIWKWKGLGILGKGQGHHVGRKSKSNPRETSQVSLRASDISLAGKVYCQTGSGGRVRPQSV